MKPIKFKEANTTFAKDQPQYQPLPALVKEGQHGDVVTCWHLSFKERAKILITGKLWLNMMTFKKPLTPVYLTVNKEEVI